MRRYHWSLYEMIRGSSVTSPVWCWPAFKWCWSHSRCQIFSEFNSDTQSNVMFSPSYLPSIIRSVNIIIFIKWCIRLSLAVFLPTEHDQWLLVFRIWWESSKTLPRVWRKPVRCDAGVQFLRPFSCTTKHWSPAVSSGIAHLFIACFCTWHWRDTCVCVCARAWLPFQLVFQ